LVTRRWFLNAGAGGLGLAALWSLLGEDLVWAAGQAGSAGQAGAAALGGLPGLPHFAPRAKRVIYMFMSGAPSHIDLFDYKPKLKELMNTELPASVRMGQRITGMTSGQKQLLVVGSPFEFKKLGKCQAELSELLPHTGSICQPTQARYWGNGFLPGNYQGVPFRSGGDPILYVSNPKGMSMKARRQLLDRMQELNRLALGRLGDPEIATQIDNYEMAYR